MTRADSDDGPARRRFLAGLAGGAALGPAWPAAAQARSGPLSVVEFGARGDGAHDDTAAIQAAIDLAASRGGGEVLLPMPEIGYRVTTLRLKPGVTLAGDAPWGGPESPRRPGTILGSPGQDAIVIDGDKGFAYSLGLRDLAVHGGRNQLVSPEHTVWCAIRNVRFHSPEEAGIRCRGFVQNWYVDNVEFQRGLYGYWQEALPGPVSGEDSLLDKCAFRAVTCSGQKRNGFRVEVKLSNNVLFDALSLIQAGEHGFVIDGGVRFWTFLNVNTEGNNFDDPAPGETRVGVAPALTVGAIAAGVAVLTVADERGYRVGAEIVVAGAGREGFDFEARVVQVAGNRLSLDRAAAVAVTDAEVTAARFSDFFIDSTVAGVAGITWIDAAVGHPNAAGGSRYAIDAARAAGPLLVIGGSAPRPIYDPYNKVSVLGGLGVAVRRRAGDVARESFETFAIGNAEQRVQVASGRGKDIVLALVDTKGDGTGAHGKLEVRRLDPNRTRIMELDAAGDVTLAGDRLTFGGQDDYGVFAGSGSPEGRVRALPGSLYLRRDGGPGASLYVKELGPGPHGWVAK